MKSSELVVRLNELIKKHGDIEVRIWNELECEFDAINEVELRRFAERQRVSDEERGKLFFGVDPYAIGDWDAQIRYDKDNC